LTEENFHFYEIEFTSALLAKNARPEFEKFRATVLGYIAEGKRQQTPVRLLFLQKGDLHESFGDWLHELGDDVLLDELYGRILGLRQLFAELRFANVFTVYGFAGNCFGTFFELALCCHRIYSFDSRALVGFPDMRLGLFPVAGVFQDLCQKFGWHRKTWEKHAVLTVAQAFELGLIRLATDALDWQDIIKRRLAKLSAPIITKEINGRLATSRLGAAKNHAANSSDEASALLAKALATIEASGYLKETAPPSRSWDLIWDLLKLKEKSMDRFQLNVIVSYLSAKQLVSREFISALGRSIKAGLPPRLRPPAITSYYVYIDADQLAPPAQTVRRLLESGYALCFLASETAVLQETLDLIYSRLERDPLAAKALEAWRRSVVWAIEAPETGKEDRLPLLSWTVDDRVRLKAGTAACELLRLAGNRGDAPAGWSELAGPALNDVDALVAELPILKCLSDGIVPTAFVTADQVRLSTFLRSAFLEEIVEVAAHAAGGLGRVLEALRDTGWSVVGDEANWEHFLRLRQEIYAVPASAVAFAGFSVNRTWQLTSWREVRRQVKEKAGGDMSNRMAVSHHFAALCGLLAKQVAADARRLAPAVHADIFVCEALGFPASLGTPLAFLETWGRVRVENYTRKYWAAVHKQPAENLSQNSEPR